MGLMLARDAFFARLGHSIQQDGLPGDIRKYKVLCSENAHFSVQKNMALMGLGYRSVTLVKTDEFARMDVCPTCRRRLRKRRLTASRSWRSSLPPAPPTRALSTRCATSPVSLRNIRSGCR
ncbi:hypothetical protein LNQ03_29990 [Klebsiella pneumoniae subsp. pneumoniae]|nr:hypothetical protein [Klebsiella pneumoniae subsp. pneumoniae]